MLCMKYVLVQFGAMNNLITLEGIIQKHDGDTITSEEYDIIMDDFIQMLEDKGCDFFGISELSSEEELALEQELLDKDYERALKN